MLQAIQNKIWREWQQTREGWAWAFGVLVCVYFLTMLMTVSDYGITSDEAGHVQYGQALIKWYTSGFQDQAVFDSKNTWLYGGLFDFLVAVIAPILPMEYYDARHLCNAFVGMLGLIGVYKMGCLFGGPRAGFLAALFLLLMPRFYGHAFNNPKDVPVAVTYIWGIYYILQCVKNYPQISRQLIVKMGLAIGAALSIRVGGLLLVFYLGVFWGLAWLRTSEKTWASLIQIVKWMLAVCGIAYGVTFVFWPYLLMHPVKGFWDAIHMFGSFPEIHFTFFEGIYVGSNETPWYYAPKWLLLTLPEYILIGVPVTVFWAVSKKRFTLPYLLILVSAFFPVFYAVGTQMPLYDGIRHLLFVLPPLAVVVALGVHALLKEQKIIVWATVCVCVICTLWGVRNLIVLHPNQYVYFNHLFAGGVAEAAQKYDTDYWENSYRQGVAWVRGQSSEKPRRIRAHYEQVQQLLDTDDFEWVHLAENADYYLAITRYDRHKLIAGEILHSVKADGVPLLYVIRPDTSYANEPFFINAPYKFAYFGGFYEGLGDTRRAKKAYEMAIQMRVDTLVTKHRMWGYYRALGLLYLNTGELDKAKEITQQAVRFDSEQAEAWYLLAQILTANGDYGAALETIQEALALYPNRDTYVTAYINIGVALQQANENKKALAIYDDVLQKTPNRADVLFNAGIAHFSLGAYQDAIQYFEKALVLTPDDLEIYLGLAQAYAGFGDIKTALDICKRGLAIDSSHSDLQAVLQQLQAKRDE